jgi:hypothetical protein
MTEPAPEPQPYPWLPLEDVLGWLQLDADTAGTVELCRRAGAAYCEQQRPELAVDVLDPVTGLVAGYVFTAGPAVVLAGTLAAARLYARRSSPAGLASYGEFGAAEVLRLDPDVARLLGTGRHATPRVG